MGRHSYSGRSTVSDLRSIDVRRWNRDGLLHPHRAFAWQWSLDGRVVASISVLTETGRVTLSYNHRREGSDWQAAQYPLHLEWTPCNFGGKRPWFLCPNCGRRVAILYGGERFACRRCHNLAYPSQREKDYDRAGRRADRIRKKLDWEPGALNGRGWKPKGMHWRTFERLVAEHDAFVRSMLAGFAAQLPLSERTVLDELSPR